MALLNSGNPGGVASGQVLLCASSAATACFFNATAVNVLTPSIARDLQATNAETGWIVLSYWLSLSVLTLCFGRLADVYGKKLLFCGGLAVFAGAAAVAAASSDPKALIVLRCVQGAAAAAVFANTAVLVADAYRDSGLGFALGRLAMVAAIAQAIGPSVGSWLAQTFGWRSVFGSSAVLGVLVLAHAVRTIPADKRSSAREQFDVVGAILSAVGLGLLCWGLTRAGSTGGLGSTAEFVAASLVLVASVMSFVVLWKWLGRSSSPLIDPMLLADRRRATLYLSVFLMAISQQGPLVVLAIYYQVVLGVPSAEIGWRLGALAFGMMLGSPFAGWSTRHVAPHKLCTVALAGLAASSLSLGAIVVLEKDAGLMICLTALGVSLALFVTPCNQMLMEGCPARDRGIVNALRASLQGAGGLTGIALVLLVAQAGLSPRMRQHLYSAGASGLNGAERAAFTEGVALALALVGVILISAAAISLAAWPMRMARASAS